jgi:hypothetical protein
MIRTSPAAAVAAAAATCPPQGLRGACARLSYEWLSYVRGLSSLLLLLLPLPPVDRRDSAGPVRGYHMSGILSGGCPGPSLDGQFPIRPGSRRTRGTPKVPRCTPFRGRRAFGFPPGGSERAPQLQGDVGRICAPPVPRLVVSFLGCRAGGPLCMPECVSKRPGLEPDLLLQIDSAGSVATLVPPWVICLWSKIRSAT